MARAARREPRGAGFGCRQDVSGERLEYDRYRVWSDITPIDDEPILQAAVGPAVDGAAMRARSRKRVTTQADATAAAAAKAK